MLSLFLSQSTSSAYLVVATEEFGRQIPYACLERIAEDFEGRFGARVSTALAHSLDKEFGCVRVRV